ncbi:MAG: hypothetical protein H7X80_10125 [bacterium]|nr:hypothetical protein [Candidatus Kapabacteria bacterium]
MFGETFDVTAYVATVANDERPLAVDIIYAYDEDMMKELMKLSARDWFERKEQILSDNPGDDMLEVFSYEWTPGTTRTVNLPLRGGTEGGVMFVNYYYDGAFRHRLDLFTDVEIAFEHHEFAVTND